MKRLSYYLSISLIVLIGFTLLSSCKRLPESKQGFYVNEEYRFSVTYPEDFVIRNPEYKYQVFLAESKLGWTFLSIVIVEKMDLTDVPNNIVKVLKTLGASDIKFLSKKHTTLIDGTSAYEVYVLWYGNQWDRTVVPVKGAYTSILIINRGNKMIGVEITDMKEVSDDFKKILYSLKFYK